MTTTYKQNDEVEVEHEIFGLVRGVVVGVVHPHINDIFVIELEDEISGYPWSHITSHQSAMRKND